MSLKVFKTHYLDLLVFVSFRLRTSTNKCAFKAVSLSSVTTQLDKRLALSKQNGCSYLVAFLCSQKYLAVLTQHLSSSCSDLD